jgi:octaprenyl-diphosphate synthase
MKASTYNEVIEKKTASLFRWAARTGALLGGADDACVERLGAFGREVGMAFQLLDDVLDYEGEGTGKSLATDVTEGKVTLPLSLAIAKDPALLAEVLKLRAGNLELASAIATRVRELSVTAVVKARAREHTVRAMALIDACAEASSPALVLLRGVAQELALRSA